jgi:LPXTG-site transpeptidase (sortase) family protein
MKNPKNEILRKSLRDGAKRTKDISDEKQTADAAESSIADKIKQLLMAEKEKINSNEMPDSPGHPSLTDPDPLGSPAKDTPENGTADVQPEGKKRSAETMRDWLMISLGLILIIFAAFNLFNANPISMLREMRVTPPVDQAGFAPIFIPRMAARPAVIEEENSLVFPPDRIVIEQIGLDAPVKIAQSINVSVEDQEVTQFLVPEEFAAGWHEGSAPLGVVGNTVISGHHNAFDEVFKELVDLETGDRVTVLSSAAEFNYVITNKMILSERNEPLEVRIENGRWILPSDDERLTLVTCWPKNSNTHRLILVAVPVKDGSQTPQTQITPTPQGSLIEVNPVLSDFMGGELIPTTGNRPAKFSVINTGRFSVNIRELPDMKGEIIGSLKSNHTAAGLGRTALGDWVLIKTDETSGWVSADLVEIRVPIEFLPTMLPTITSP